VVVLVILLLLLLLSLEERRNGKGKLAEASDEGQGPRKAVEPVIMVMMMMTTTVITIVVVAVIFWNNVLQVQSLIVIILNLLNIITEHCGRVVNAPDSYLGDLSYPDRFFVVFLNLSRQMPGWYLKLGYDCFLPNLFQFISHESLFLSTLCSLSY
jgi:hypothetical protein